MSKVTKSTPVSGGSGNRNEPPPVIKSTRTLKAKKSGSPFVDRWWLEPEERIYHHVQGVLTTIESRQAFRRVSNIRWRKLYSNYDHTAGVTGGVHGRMMASRAGSGANAFRFTLNVVESCIDGAAAKIAKSRPVPRIVTSKGSFKQRKKSMLLSKYIKGMFSELDIYEKAQQCFVDSCIWGTAALRFMVEDGQVKAKRVLVDDIIVDEEDGRDGDPRQLHQRAHVNRDVLAELFPDHVERIMTAGSMLPGDTYTPVSQDLVAVTESWHLPSSEDADDGLHVICLDNCTVFSEPWDFQWFPFAMLRWKPDPLGFYGTGLSQQLAPIQLAINKLCILIQDSIEQVSKPNMFLPNGSNIIAQQVSSKVGTVIRTQGEVPTFAVPQAQSPEVYAWLENLYSKAYQVTGISQLSAQSQKPAGLNSGAALREFQDIETSRFELTGQRFEEFFRVCGEMIIALSRQLYTSEEGKKLSAKVKGRKFIETINWKDASLEDDEFTMDMFSVSSLPDTPAGRLEAITSLAQAGYLSKEMSFELLDFPDLDEAVSVQVAAMEQARMVVDKARWDGEYTTITPLMNVTAIRDYAHSSYLDALQQDTPLDHLDLLVRMTNDAQGWIDKASAPPPGATPPPPPPLGRPMPAPTSDLVPMNGAGAPG